MAKALNRMIGSHSFPSCSISAASGQGSTVELAQAQGKAAIPIPRPVAFKLRGQAVSDPGVLLGEQAQGHLAPRPHQQARAGRPTVFGEAQLAVAAQADGVHRHGLHHGAPAADLGALPVQQGPAAFQHGDVGGGSAHIGDHHLGLTGQVAGADDTCRRSG